MESIAFAPTAVAEMTPQRRATDVASSRLSFALPQVVSIVATTLSVALVMWAANAGQNRKIDALDAKFNVVLVNLQSQKELREQEAKLNEERLSNMRETIRKMEARIEMIQIQSAARDKEINDSLVMLKSRR